MPTSQSRSFEFYRHLYEAEWDRRDEVRRATILPVGVLSVLGGAFVYYLQSYTFPGGWSTVVFLVSTVVAGIAFLTAAYMLARSLFGPHYRRIPWPSQIREYEEALRQFHAAHPSGEESARLEWEQFLLDRYIDAANRNAENNANAGEYVHKANRAVITILAALILGAVPVLMDARASQPRQSTTSFTDWKEAKMSNEHPTDSSPQGSGSPDASQPSGDSPQQAPQETKPPAPSNVDIRTGSKAPETKGRGGGSK